MQGTTSQQVELANDHLGYISLQECNLYCLDN